MLHDAIENLLVPERTFNIRRIFLFHKRFFVVKESSSEYQKIRKRWIVKETLPEWFFVVTKMVLHGIAVKNLLSIFNFKSVG